ncbi:MAG: hypothetical protein Q4A30_02710, partial [Candidatus Saccharibacteria bacterium]|nr:hypothetical protein [Candidatus Saccharibacteria bacterium]
AVGWFEVELLADGSWLLGRVVGIEGFGRLVQCEALKSWFFLDRFAQLGRVEDLPLLDCRRYAFLDWARALELLCPLFEFDFFDLSPYFY